MSPEPVNTLWSAIIVKNDNPIEHERMLEANRVKDEERRRLKPTRTREERVADARQAKELQEAKARSLTVECRRNKIARDKATNAERQADEKLYPDMQRAMADVGSDHEGSGGEDAEPPK